MARSYHVDIAIDATDVDRKWMDNLLSHHSIHGVEASQRGVARRISDDGILHIALIKQLARQLGLGVADAVTLAGQLLDARDGRVSISADIELRLDRTAFKVGVDRRIADAVESVTPAPRGRPRRRSTG